MIIFKVPDKVIVGNLGILEYREADNKELIIVRGGCPGIQCVEMLVPGLFVWENVIW